MTLHQEGIANFDHIILGAGPAGLQLALFFQEHGMSYVVLEQNSLVGSFFDRFPRHKRLISVNKHHTFPCHRNTLRHDWNSLILPPVLRGTSNMLFGKQYSTDFYPPANSYVTYLKDLTETLHLQVRLECPVYHISRSHGGFQLTGGLQKDSLFQCQNLYIATGVRPKPIDPLLLKYATLLGYETLDYATMPLDPDMYKDKGVFIVGTGNAAFETANYLNSYAASIGMVGPSRLAWKTHYPGHLRSVNMAFLDTFYLKTGNVIYWDYDRTMILSPIQQYAEFLQASGLSLSYVIWCGGFEPNLPTMDENIRPTCYESGYPYLNATFESINVRNLYFIGTLMQGSEYKTGTSTFIHGFRYNIEFLARHLTKKIVPCPLRHTTELLDQIIMRLQTGTDLYHRLGDWTDYIVLQKNTEKHPFLYYAGVPTLYVRDVLEKEKRPSSLRMSIEYGPKPFKWDMRQPDYLISNGQAISQFTHPVFYAYSEKTNMSRTIHTAESVTSEFNIPEIHYAIIEKILLFATSAMSDQDYIELLDAIDCIDRTYYENKQRRFDACLSKARSE